MDPHLPFLKAIVAARHDDLPRLVYADFLEETGDPPHLARAHFIRTQIHLESADPKSPLFAELQAFEERLLDDYDADWLLELPERFGIVAPFQNVVWRRGFPDDLGPLTVFQFERFARITLLDLPLTALHIADHASPMDFARYPQLAHISKLALTTILPFTLSSRWESSTDNPTFDSLLSAPVFTALRHLHLSDNQLSDAWLVRFAAAFPNASFAPTLETLDLSRNFGITDAGANTLATATGFDRLKRLIVADTGIGPAGMRMLRKRFGDRQR